MKKMLLSILSLICFTSGNSQQTRKINGEVRFSGQLLENASIHVKHTSNGVTTDQDGKYFIDTKVNDTLVYSFQGMKTTEAIVFNSSATINMKLAQEIEDLKEIVVKKKIFLTQKELLEAYSKNKRLIKTSLGILDKDRTSFSIRLINGDELVPFGADFLYSLENLIPNLTVDRTQPEERIFPKVYLQSWSHGSKPTVIFDVDGFIYEQPPTFIQANDIDRIAVLVRNGAFMRYGTQGAGGVIIINTKSKNWMDEKSLNRTYDNSNLLNGIYTKLNKKEKYTPSKPEYMNDFESSKTVSNNYKLFERLKNKYGSSPYYYVDVASFFQKQLNNKEVSLNILNQVKNNFPNDVAALKSLAYTYEKQEQFDKSLEIYLQILNIKPMDAQSYRDVANTHSLLGNHQKALRFYTHYRTANIHSDILPFDKFGADQMIYTETNHTLNLNNEKLFGKKKLNEKNSNKTRTRIVLEWNNDQAEFELNFNNEIDAFNWKNIISSSTDELLQKQKIKGYNSKQFFFNNSSNNEWFFNMHYFGNKSKTPTYLKVTVQFDYENINSTKKVEIFKLVQPISDTHLFTIDLNSKSIL